MDHFNSKTQQQVFSWYHCVYYYLIYYYLYHCVYIIPRTKKLYPLLMTARHHTQIITSIIYTNYVLYQEQNAYKYHIHKLLQVSYTQIMYYTKNRMLTSIIYTNYYKYHIHKLCILYQEQNAYKNPSVEMSNLFFS